MRDSERESESEKWNTFGWCGLKGERERERERNFVSLSSAFMIRNLNLFVEEFGLWEIKIEIFNEI